MPNGSPVLRVLTQQCLRKNTQQEWKSDCLSICVRLAVGCEAGLSLPGSDLCLGGRLQPIFAAEAEISL